MDIVFTAVGVILVLAMWPALVIYARNDPLLRHPRRANLRGLVPHRPHRAGRVAPGLRKSAPGTP